MPKMTDSPTTEQFVSFDGKKLVVVDVHGDQYVEISKLFGPLVACDVRVRLDVAGAQWIVERERLKLDGDQSWEEMARFDCQESIESEGRK